MRFNLRKYKNWIFVGIGFWIALLVIFNVTIQYAYPGFAISTLGFLLGGAFLWMYGKKKRNERKQE